MDLDPENTTQIIQKSVLLESEELALANVWKQSQKLRDLGPVNM
jgi:hypothetical protein